jgi:DNA-binding PadR family transcriptional regulator
MYDIYGKIKGAFAMKEITVLEEMILTTIFRLGEDAYGVSIRRKVSEITKKEIIYGTLYNTLDQLLRKGYVRKRLGKPTAQRGGRGKIYYSLTAKGVKALQNARELHRKIWDGIPDLLTDKVKSS